MKNIKKTKVDPKINYQAQPVTPEVVDLLISGKLQQLFAEVDPEYLKKLSVLVERELTAYKDTEDYNMDLVSEVVDKAIRVFMDGGQNSINPGDYIKVEDKITSKLDGTTTDKDFKNSVASGEYESYPYTAQVEAELRSIFLLQTNKKDTFKSLMEDFDALGGKFMSLEHLKIIKDCITKSEDRIFKNTLVFPSPIEGNEQGVVRNLTDGEVTEYNLQTSITVDERFDNHDLLALKDLVLMMSGNKVHPLAFGPSFFAKYIPEIKQAGFEGVLLVVEDGLLKAIKLGKLPVGDIRFSPVQAASLIYFNIMSDFKMIPAAPNSLNKLECDFIGDEKSLKDNMKVYVVVDGCVAIPANKTPYTYEGVSKNDARLNAGEIFVMEQIESKPVLTRIGFVPYDYRQLHIFHQHGSVILGSNDQSMQSCYKDSRDFAEDVINEYRDYWKKIVDSGDSLGDAFSPSVVAARIHHFLKDAEGKSSAGVDILNKENKKSLELAIHSISEQNGFTLAWTLDNLHFYHMVYTGTVHEQITKLLEFEAPLNRRWLAKTYLENGSGITVQKQPTFYVKLANDLKQAKLTQNVEFYLKMKTIEQKVSGGLSYEESIKQVYAVEVAEEYKKLN